ncbi:hypothetical protein PMAYCL1PPCAC_20909, partial [Pristionchus mayeri]
PTLTYRNLLDQADLGITFAGCGFLCTYHFGVIKCLMRNGKTLTSRIRRVSGASAGSLVAAMTVLSPDKLDESMEVIMAMADKIHSLPFGALTPGFNLGEQLVEVLGKFFPQDISVADHRLFISLTQHKTRVNCLVSTYPDRAYLITCLSASCYIPMYTSGLTAPVPVIDGEPWVDGGYTNNLPDYSDLRTITVSPLCMVCDITPPHDAFFDWTIGMANMHLKVKFRNILRGAQTLFPPSRRRLRQFYEQGYRDAFKFLLDNDMLERDTGSSV